MDYKNTPEGRAVQSKYADLLSLSGPAPIKSRMTIQNRAKIFSPFAALRGYEDEIASEGKDHLKVQRIELSEEEKAKLSDTLCRLRKGQPISVRYFIGGYYENISGTVEVIDPVASELRISTGTKTSLGKDASTLPVPFLFPLRLFRQLCFSLLGCFPCNARRSDPADFLQADNTLVPFSSNTLPASLSVFL